MVHSRKLYAVLCFVVCLGIAACAEKKSSIETPQADGPYPALLIAQAQFIYEKKGDKKIPKPGPALVTIKQKTPAGWKDTILEDPQSNVFHKALFIKDGDAQKIVTIGAMEAALKLWEYKGNSLQQQVLWNPVFGGKWNRLRDIEIADVTGDGQEDMVIATHDQGVIAVATKSDQGWNISEIDREPDIFVHEIEIGDVDGDGKKEFFTTPSRPNKAKGGPQPGKVAMYAWNGKAFEKKVVDSYDRTHAKEILAADIEGKGTATLFSVYEAETKQEQGKTVRVEPVKIKQYAFKKDGSVTSTVIATLDDYQCRFLCAGDIDGDGKVELVAAAMKTGIWLLRQDGDSWKKELIDADSSGYEHTTYLADLDSDGTEEIYVASDDQGELRVYAWNGKAFDKKVIGLISKNKITWNITTGKI